MHKTVTPKKYSLVSITYAFCGLVILGILILTIVSSIKVDQLLRHELRVRIADVVNIMAKNIDGDLHSKVQTTTDNKSPAFTKLKNDLVAMRQRSTNVANIYTMRKLDNGAIVFIVDGSKEGQNEIGDIYPKESISEALKDAFNATPETTKIYVDAEIDQDDWGTWLSAYAPIFTASGKFDGIIGIDVSAKSIRAHELEYLGTFGAIAVVVILLVLPFVFWLMNFIKTINLELQQVNHELAVQNNEKEKQASELSIANENLAAVNEEYEVTNEELIFQNSEKEKRAAELAIVNQELIFQNNETAARTMELAIINIQNVERDKRTVELTLANKELAFQNAEKEKRAEELDITNDNLIALYDEKVALAAKLIKTNEKLAFQNSEKEKRAEELDITNDNLIALYDEKTALVTDLMIANEELIFQSIETEKRATELTQSYDENALLNDQVNHMQKLESLGQLTAGIAHDFNNILACILGYNELNQCVSEDMTDEELKINLERNTKQIDFAGQRAVSLIQKMMTYCRQNVKTANINVKPTLAIIDEVLAMLRPALTSRIKIELALNPQPCHQNIEIDAIDLHQILTNLVVNARDAMKERGGIITISLKTVTRLNKHCVACAEMVDGDFIELSVADNGTGIEPHIISRIFDPFFTTKQVGEGTGLGLSTVIGMVHQSHGHVLIDSNLIEPNQGTVFKLLFPIPATA
ncbi:MAG: ATP-binding protein [Methylococcaceae bacterium]